MCEGKNHKRFKNIWYTKPINVCWQFSFWRFFVYFSEDGANGMQVGDIEYTVGEVQCATTVISPLFWLRFS